MNARPMLVVQVFLATILLKYRWLEGRVREMALGCYWRGGEGHSTRYKASLMGSKHLGLFEACCGVGT